MPDLQTVPIKPGEDTIKVVAPPTQPTTTPPIQNDTMELAKKRLEAKLAMEGEGRRLAREEEEKQRREAENMARLEEERKKMTELQQQKLAEEERMMSERERAERSKKSTEIAQTVEEIKSESGATRPIRTLRADMENLIKTNNISLVGIAIKEEEKRRRGIESKNIGSKTNLTLIIVSTLLILGTIGIGGYFYLNKIGAFKSIPDIIFPKNNQPKPLIPAEKTKEIDITNKSSDEVITRTIRDAVRYPEDLLISRTENILLTRKTGSDTHYLTLQEFMTTIGTNPPSQLARSLSSDFMFGVLSATENAGFLVVTTDSYSSAFAGLLEWEKKGMAKDLYQVLTTIKPEQELLSKPFEDLTIKNIGTRILKDKNGTIRIVYSFLDSTKTIVIAGSKDAFLDVLSSFQTPKPISQ